MLRRRRRNEHIHKMKITKNDKLINRNSKIGTFLSLGALVVLGLGMYISIARQDLFIYALIALLLGFTMTQVGMYMGNRFSRKPRPDEKLDAGLKGLTGDYTIYHYNTPASHLLVGPAGLWLLFPYHQRGHVVYRKNRWQMSGGGFMQSYMRIFGQEGLGRPDIEIDKETESLKKFLSKHMEEGEVPPINSLLVFTSDEVEIDSEGANVPALKVKQLKDFIRQKAKEKPIGQLQLAAVKDTLPQE